MRKFFLFSIVVFCLFTLFVKYGFSQVVVDDPEVIVNSYYEDATFLLERGKLDKAEYFYRKALIVSPGAEKVNFGLGCVLALKDNYTDAIEYFEKCLDTEDNELKPFIYFNIGGIYYKQGITRGDDISLKLAQKYFQKVITTLKDWGLVKEMYSSCVFNSAGQKETLVINYLDTPADSSVFTKTSGSAEKDGYVIDKDAPAVIYFYQSPSTYLVLAGEQKLENYHKYLDKALELVKNKQDSMFNKVLKFNCLMDKADALKEGADKQETEKAVGYLKEAISLGLDFPRSFVYLGMIYYYQKEYNLARECAERSLRIDPEYLKAKMLVEMIKNDTEKNRVP